MFSLYEKAFWLICFIVILCNLISCENKGQHVKKRDAGQFETVDFAHERCQLETLSTKTYRIFYPAKIFYNKNHIFEILVRFKGVADGHVTLTSAASENGPRYVISLGSYNNKVSEIRKVNTNETLEFKMNTPNILTAMQFRGFIIRYNPYSKMLYVFAEGGDVPILHLTDEEPIKINYFSFATWSNRVVLAAFNCQPKDGHSYFNNDDSTTDFAKNQTGSV